MRIRGAGTEEQGAFGTVYVVPYVIINGCTDHEAGACSNGRANQKVSPLVVSPYLPGNVKDVFAGQRLLTLCLPKRNSVAAPRPELTSVGFDIVHYDANFLTRRQGFEIVPAA